jgi:hypothetical protein
MQLTVGIQEVTVVFVCQCQARIHWAFHAFNESMMVYRFGSTVGRSWKVRISITKIKTCIYSCWTHGTSAVYDFAAHCEYDPSNWSATGAQ